MPVWNRGYDCTVIMRYIAADRICERSPLPFRKVSYSCAVVYALSLVICKIAI